jgi:glycosyltransferase involved in cell wall biosynthesis
MAERFERAFYKQSAGVTGQSREIVESIRRRMPHIRTEVITNGVDPRRFGREKADDSARALLGRKTGLLITYAGLLGHAQGLDQVLDLAKALPDSSDEFVLIGDGPAREHLVKRIRTEGIQRVRILAAQPRHRIPAILAASDVAIVPLRTSMPGAVPSKIYEAMASSLPILIIADGEAADRVVEAGAGLAASPGDGLSALAACKRLLGDPLLRDRLGAAGRKAAEETYNRRRIAERLDRFLRETLRHAGQRYHSPRHEAWSHRRHQP